MASFKPVNAPVSNDMQNFRAALDALGGPAKQCRFAIRVLPVGTDNGLLKLGYGSFIRDLTLLSEALEFPGRGMDFGDYRYYGPSFQTPYNSNYGGQTDITFICRTDSWERQFFDDWMEMINPSDTFDFNYPESYYSEIQIYQLSDWGDNNAPNQYRAAEPGSIQLSSTKPATAVYQWTLIRAWPFRVNPQPVTWADQDILRLTVSFSYRYWYRPGRDVTPTQGTLTITQ